MPEPTVTPDQLVSGQRREPSPRGWPVLAVISAGGVVGGVARHGVTEVFGGPPGGFPSATFAINVSGCLLLGVLMVLISEVWIGRRLLRPFLGVGVLGGFTTFSTYVVDIQRTVAAGSPGVALLYLAATVVGALVAVWVGALVAGWIVAAVTARAARARRASRGPVAR